MGQMNAFPTPDKNGWFDGREKKWEPCDCFVGKSVDVETGEECLEQTVEMHREAGRMLQVTSLLRSAIRSQLVNSVFGDDEGGITIIGVFSSEDAPAQSGTDGDNGPLGGFFRRFRGDR